MLLRVRKSQGQQIVDLPFDCPGDAATRSPVLLHDDRRDRPDARVVAAIEASRAARPTVPARSAIEPSRAPAAPEPARTAIEALRPASTASPDRGAGDVRATAQKPAERGFVLQVSPDCDPSSGRLSGRLVHMRTSDGGNFDSVESLLALVWRVLERSREQHC
jgi:hypothetical protein